MAKLTKRELDYLHPAAILRLKIEVQHWRKTPCWDGDPLLPVKVGKVCESLIERGYLERIDDRFYKNQATIRATKKCFELVCRECHGRGKVFNDDDIEIGDCPHCYSGLKQQGDA
ncbi:hypothetical protein ACTVPA_20055 [Serratia bockelmannii]|uniref:hypothetical protein n=1 Tax=Serratia bockelmannii TaxID=2703793 RepID=UPI003E32EBC7